MNDEVMKLGKLMIKDLDLQEYDYLNKWMIMYIAEQMKKYDFEENEEAKMEIGNHCSDIIIKFWKSRSYNSEWYPLEKYKELLDALNELLSAEINLKFFDRLNYENEQSNSLVDNVKKVKKTTGWLIEEFLIRGYSTIKSEEDEEWIDASKDLQASDDVKILKILETLGESKEKILKDHLEYRIQMIEDTLLVFKEFLEEEKQQLSEICS